MLTSLIVNLLAVLMTFSVSGGILLHSTSADKAFATVVSRESDTTVRDFGHSLTNELHVHSVRQAVNSGMTSDPSLENHTHKKHTSQPHARVKLAALTA